MEWLQVSISKMKISYVVVCTLIICQIILFALPAVAKGDDKSINAVLVLDRTGSMKSSDPEMLSQEASKVFIDLMAVNGSSVGVVEYTDKVVGRFDILSINQKQDKDKVKQYVDNLGNPTGQNTDLSTGLKEAAVMLAEKKSPVKSVIILLADGKNDLKGSERTEELSKRDLQKAIEITKNNNIYVYTIGLNSDQTCDTKVLSYIAKETGGKTYIVEKADDIPQILSNIYADVLDYKILSIGSGTLKLSGDFDTYNFEVSNSSVAEANIVVQKKSDVVVKIYDPNNNEVVWDNKKYIESLSRKVMSYKIINPAKGTWRVTVKGIKNEEIKITLLYNYDLKIVMNSIEKIKDKNGYFNVSAYLMQDNKAINDQDLYRDMVATCNIENMNGDIIKKVPLKVNDDLEYTGQITLDKSGEYKVYVAAEGKMLIRKSEPQTIKFTAVNSESSERKAVPWKKFIYLVVLIILVIVLIFIVLIILKNRGPRILFGSIDFKIINTLSGIEETAGNRTLSSYGKEVNLATLTGREIDLLRDIIVTRSGKSILLINRLNKQSGFVCTVDGEKVIPGQSAVLNAHSLVRIILDAEQLKLEGKFKN